MQSVEFILQSIGIITILYLGYKLYQKKLISDAAKEQEFNHLVFLLKTYQPDIKRIYSIYESEHYKFYKLKQKDVSSSYEEPYQILFGKTVFCVYPHTLKELESAIITKVKELQSSPKGREEIKEIENIWKKFKKQSS